MKDDSRIGAQAGDSDGYMAPEQHGSRPRHGFAGMAPELRRELASKGGKAAHAKGTAHEYSSDEAKVAGRKGGESVARNRAHMAEIGRKGGEKTAQNPERMAELGRKGAIRLRNQQPSLEVGDGDGGPP
jgi:general stress protein YciG